MSGLATRPQITESVLVFAHGAGAGMTHPFMAAVASGLAARRIATLRYQFPYMQAGRHRVDSGPACHATVRAAVARASAMWPDVPLFAGGKSFGGRMTSQAQALAPLRGVSGLVFLGFPLHPAGKPSVDRAAHLVSIDVPMLFLHGSRDALAESALFSRMANDLGPLASPTELAGADHGFHVLRTILCRACRGDDRRAQEGQLRIDPRQLQVREQPLSDRELLFARDRQGAARL